MSYSKEELEAKFGGEWELDRFNIFACWVSHDHEVRYNPQHGLYRLCTIDYSILGIVDHKVETTDSEDKVKEFIAESKIARSGSI